MVETARADEWRVIEGLLPAQWREAARELGAFRRARYIMDPAQLLRLLLFHAVNDAGLRQTVAQARGSGVATMSQVALFKRLKTSGAWLAWLGSELARQLGEQPRLPQALRPRVIDGTSVQGPASKGTDWRVHYSLDLITLHCDWAELTDVHGIESLERTPIKEGDVLLADRYYLRPAGIRHVSDAGGYVLVRMGWCHSPMLGASERRFNALQHARRLGVGKVGAWPVRLLVPGGNPIPGRVVTTKLPAPVAAKAERRAAKIAAKRSRQIDSRTLEAAHFVMVFTTLPETMLKAAEVLELYRYRWQIELAFKRLKQLLKLGRLPHKEPAAARAWILAKLVVALLLETLYRNARAVSPWGYRLGFAERSA
jgi:Transposase DDE domain